ncbi:hypothetical protein WJX72_003412 [[Myrmecia] bisecta]|uniref:Uncharacterized protein n=1 Tax=[Myrmecia] bisecta TaxID=41462 RepID=A0AAW1P1U6_9CHLO
MSVPLAVYRALRRSVQVYSAQSVPLTGVAGLGIRCTAGDAVAELQRQFREAQQGSSQAADQGFAVLRRLQAQAQVFTQADEHTRQALAQWNALLSSTRPLVQRGGALAVATAVESGAMLVHKLHCDVTATPVGIDADSGDTAPSAAAVLDDLASTVRQQLPGGAQAREVHHDVDCQANMLHTLGKVLFQELRFRQAVVDVWAEHARVAMIANQRRGDGDAVAFWLYQLLALDPNANEWGDVMPM